ASGPQNNCQWDLAWSPDGKTMVCVIIQPDGATLTGLLATDVSNGRQNVFFHSDAIFNAIAWLPDGNGLLLLSRDYISSYARNQIAFISYPEGKYRPVTNDVNDYSGLSLTADGHSLATVLNERHWDLFFVSASAAGSGQARQVTSGQSVSSFSWTPTGQLVLDQKTALNLLNPDSGVKTTFPMEEHAIAGDPSACANGRYIVFGFFGHAGNKTEVIGRMDPDGGNVRPLTGGKLDANPVCSPDSRWVFYRDGASDSRLMKVSIDGGTPQQVSDQTLNWNFDISPDGKLAAFATFRHVGEHRETLALVSLDSNQPAKMLTFQHPPSSVVRFSPDGKAVVYPTRDHDVDNLWQQPLDGSPGKQITNFTSEHIGDSFGWSPDGSKLAIIRGHVDSDVVLIRDSRQ
ncbi:MAG: TolB family protein, partial [Candidatus Dormibacteraceae bacterium]